MTIVLFHSHYDVEHLAKVKKEMLTLGAPEIKCFRDEANGVWMAFEGCHRIRAAKELGLMPVIVPVDYDEDITIQIDDEYQTIPVQELLDSNTYSNATIIDFDEEE